MHAMSRFPLRILSNASACPSFDSAGLTVGGGSKGMIPRTAASPRSESARTVLPAFAISGALGGAVASSLQPDKTIREAHAASVPKATWILMPHLPFICLSGGTTGDAIHDTAGAGSKLLRGLERRFSPNEQVIDRQRWLALQPLMHQVVETCTGRA
jgi:hypothetical protein